MIRLLQMVKKQTNLMNFQKAEKKKKENFQEPLLFFTILPKSIQDWGVGEEELPFPKISLLLTAFYLFSHRTRANQLYAVCFCWTSRHRGQQLSC